MERLTFKAGGFNAFSDKNMSTYGGTQKDGSVIYIGSVADKLAKYEDLEEQGKLLKLPCAVGDTVYEVQDIRKRVQEYVVIAIHVSNCGNLYGWELKDGKGVYSNVNGFSEYAIGKTVFLTREEAEAALSELQR